MRAIRLLATCLAAVLGLLPLPGVVRAQHSPALDPPLLIRPDTGPAPMPAAPEALGPASVEWTRHKTADGQHPDGNEQAMLWLMNRARQNPSAEGVFLATSNEPDVADGRAFFQVNLMVLEAEFAGIAAKPPAAFDNRLYEAARAHSLDLIARDAQDHDGQFARVDAAGFHAGQLRGSVFSFADSALNAHAALNIDWGPGDGTGMQPGRGHRAAIMSTDGNYANVGIAMVPESSPATSVGPLVMTGNYAAALANGVDHFNRFLVGTVWRDLNGNGRYDPGEGLAGVTVTPGQGDFFAVTGAAGGYAIPLTAPGAYTVQFSGGPVGAGAAFSVTVGAQSALLDYVFVPAAGPSPAQAAFVAGFYREILGREPTAPETSSWVSFLRADPSVVNAGRMVHTFLDGPEYAARAVTPAGHVTLLYRLLLERAPDAPGLDGWVRDLAARFAPALGAFIDSAEFQFLVRSAQGRTGVDALVVRLYQTALGRTPGASEVAAWTDYILATGDFRGAAAAFFESREYTSTPRTLAEHVTRLYRAFLGREPEPGAVTPWVDFLVVQRAGLADAFIQSPEFAFRLRTLFP
jgi:hypothetical protein